MKRILLSSSAAVMLVLLAGCAAPQPSAPAGSGIGLIDSENGLPNAPIGAPVSAFEGLELVDEAGAFTSYRRVKDTTRYDRFTVDEIVYHFFDGKLYSIHIGLSDPKNVKGILNVLLKKYGEQNSLTEKKFKDGDASLIVREWNGTHVDIVLKYASDFGGGQLIFVDRAQWEKLEKPRQTEIKQLKDALSGSMLNLDFD